MDGTTGANRLCAMWAIKATEMFQTM